jgi:hypothetical protein
VSGRWEELAFPPLDTQLKKLKQRYTHGNPFNFKGNGWDNALILRSWALFGSSYENSK